MADPSLVVTPQPRRIFTATLVIGASGRGKTSLAATFAEYLWETFRKVLLLKSCDGGAFPTIIQRRIRQGLIRAWRMRTRSAEGLAFETCYLASKGYWPKVINPETGETAPAVQLVPPVTARYDCHCPQGHLLMSVPNMALIVPTFCTVCRDMVTTDRMKIAETTKQTKGFEQVGGEFFDGLTSMCSWFMGELDVSRGHGFIGGEKPPLGGPVKSGEIVFGGNNRADYGFAQTRAHQIVHNALSIPNLCEGPIFTALPDDVTEGGGQLPIVGPKLAGSALTADALQWFGNALETMIEKNDSGWDIRRLYLSEYIDSQNRRHLLKNSGPGTLPKYLEDPPVDPNAPAIEREAKFFSGFHLGHFFKLLDQALVESLARDEKVLGQLPGIGAAPTEYGEALTVQAGTGVAPSAAPGAPLPAAAPSAAPSPAPSAGPPAGGTSAAPRPRARRQPAMATPAVQPQLAPIDAPAVSQTAPVAVQPPVIPTPSAAPVAPPSPVPAGSVPPPPGMRPPQKAPGS